jgi:hypothetical protein
MLTFRILLLIGEELVAAVAFLVFREETRRLFRPKESKNAAPFLEAPEQAPPDRVEEGPTAGSVS